MICSMAYQAALACSESIVHEIQFSVRTWLHNAYIEIYEVRIIHGATLHIADPMWIVTSVAWCLFPNYMFVMDLSLYGLTHIRIILTAAMARVAQFVGKS